MTLPTAVNSFVVVVPVFNNFTLATECISRILEYTDKSVEVFVIDDASTEGDFQLVAPKSNSRITFVRNDINLGFVGSANKGFELAGTNDVILVNSDVLVTPQWSDRLQVDAYRSDVIATVTAMADEGSITSVRLGDRNLLHTSVDDIAKLSDYLASLEPLPPATIPVGVGHCIYIKRIALTAVGNFDEIFSPGYGEEVDFCMRALKMGFIHTMSNSVIVKHLSGASFGLSKSNLKRDHEKIINSRYPGYALYISTFENHNDVQESLFLRVLTKTFGMRVLLDGRRMSKSQSGTNIVSVEFAKHLASDPEFHGTVQVLTGLTEEEASKILPGIEIINAAELERMSEAGERFDVFVAPFQVGDESFFAEKKRWAYRSLILQLDYIAFDNPFYHPSIEAFRNYQRSAVLAGQKIDTVLYNSNYVANESVRVGQSRSVVGDSFIIFNGLDHLAVNNEAVKQASTSPRIGLIGTSFHHKNRVYAFEIDKSLIQIFPNVELHLIGIEPIWGSSNSAEHDWLIANPEMQDHIIYHGPLTETRKQKVVSSLDLLIVPTLSEGFGLAPFDGLFAGIPSVFPRLHSLAEILPDPPVHLQLLNAEHDAQVVAQLLTDETLRQSQLDYLLRVQKEFSWCKSGSFLRQAIEQVVIELPKAPSVIVEWQPQPIHLTWRTFVQALGTTGLMTTLLPVNSVRRRFLNRAVTPRYVLGKVIDYFARIRTRRSFDTKYYRQQVRHLNLEPGLEFEHFETVGWRMRLNPNDWFETHFYLENNPDVETRGENPLLHYFRFGKREGRLPNYISSVKPTIRKGFGTTIEMDAIPPEIASRIFIQAGRNCSVVLKGIDVLETSLSIHMADNCTFIMDAGQRIRGPLVVNLNEGSTVIIGADCLIANCQIWTSDSHSIVDAESGERLNPARDVTVGERVWIGQGAMILKGSMIGSGSIIGAQSVVTKEFAKESSIGGNPARLLKEGVTWTEEII